MAGLTRGANVNLSREVPGLSRVTLGLGWAADPDPVIEANLTPAVLLCNDAGTVPSEAHVVFFNQPVGPDGSVALIPTTSEYDRAQVALDLAALHADVARVVAVLYLNEGIGARRVLSQTRRVHARLLNAETGAQIIASEDLAPALGSETAASLAEVYRHGADWKFKVTGQGFVTGIAGVLQRYGVWA